MFSIFETTLIYNFLEGYTRNISRKYVLVKKLYLILQPGQQLFCFYLASAIAQLGKGSSQLYKNWYKVGIAVRITV